MADLKKAKAEAEQIRKSNRKKILKAEMSQPHYRFPISKIVDFHNMKGDTATIEALKTWESEMPDGAVRTGLAKSRKLLEKGKTEHWLAPLVYRAVKNTDLGDKIFETISLPGADNPKAVATKMAERPVEFFLQVQNAVDGDIADYDNDMVEEYGNIPNFFSPSSNIDKNFVEALSPEQQMTLIKLSPQQQAEVVGQAKQLVAEQGVSPAEAANVVAAKVLSAPKELPMDAKLMMQTGRKSPANTMELAAKPKMQTPKGAQVELPVQELNDGGSVWYKPWTWGRDDEDEDEKKVPPLPQGVPSGRLDSKGVAPSRADYEYLRDVVELNQNEGVPATSVPMPEEDAVQTNFRLFGGDSWENYKNVVGGIESDNRYDIQGGYNNHYTGRYQLGDAAISDASKALGIDVPTDAELRKNPDLQDALFKQHTQLNHNTMLRLSDEYKALSPQEQQQVLAYAHNQGAGGAIKYLRDGEVGRDGFGTAGTKYSDAIRGSQSGAYTGGRGGRAKYNTVEEIVGESPRGWNDQAPVTMSQDQADAFNTRIFNSLPETTQMEVLFDERNKAAEARDTDLVNHYDRIISDRRTAGQYGGRGDGRADMSNSAGRYIEGTHPASGFTGVSVPYPTEGLGAEGEFGGTPTRLDEGPLLVPSPVNDVAPTVTPAGFNEAAGFAGDVPPPVAPAAPVPNPRGWNDQAPVVMTDDEASNWNNQTFNAMPAGQQMEILTAERNKALDAGDTQLAAHYDRMISERRSGKTYGGRGDGRADQSNSVVPNVVPPMAPAGSNEAAGFDGDIPPPVSPIPSIPNPRGRMDEAPERMTYEEARDWKNTAFGKLDASEQIRILTVERDKALQAGDTQLVNHYEGLMSEIRDDMQYSGRGETNPAPVKPDADAEKSAKTYGPQPVKARPGGHAGRVWDKRYGKSHNADGSPKATSGYDSKDGQRLTNISKEELAELREAALAPAEDTVRKSNQKVSAMPKSQRDEAVRKGISVIENSDGSSIKKVMTPNGTAFVVVDAAGKVRPASVAEINKAKKTLAGNNDGADQIVPAEVQKAKFVEDYKEANPDATDADALIAYEDKVQSQVADSVNAEGEVNPDAPVNAKPKDVERHPTGNAEVDATIAGSLGEAKTVGEQIAYIEAKIESFKKERSVAWKKSALTGLIGYALVALTGGTFAQAMEAAKFGMQVGGGDLDFLNRQLDMYEGLYTEVVSGQFKGLLAKKFPNSTKAASDDFEVFADTYVDGAGKEYHKLKNRPGYLGPDGKIITDASDLGLTKTGTQSFDLPSHLEKNVSTAEEKAYNSQKAADDIDGVIADLNEFGGNEGLLGWMTETAKGWFGYENGVTQWKADYTRMKNQDAIKNLPPGVASDKDIEMVMKGFPTENWDKEQLRSWLRGYKKVKLYEARYNEFKSNYIYENRTSAGINDAWFESEKYSDWAVSTVEATDNNSGTTSNNIEWEVVEE